MAKAYAGIVGIGAYVPEKRLTNHDLEKMVDTSDEWIRTRTGIVERRIVEGDIATSDLAVPAAKAALLDAGIGVDDVDLILATTSTPDMIFPSTACLIQKKLGIKNCAAFDLQAACTGFVYGLAVASQFIETGMYKTVLLIGADAFTKHINWKDRGTCILFGDGAGAVVLQQVEEGYGVLGSYLDADGKGSDLLKIPAGGSLQPGNEFTVKNGLHYVQMNGNEVFKFAVRILPEAATKVLNEVGLSIDDVDYLIPHQANMRIITAAAERLGIKQEKIAVNIEMYGNTSTASIPLALNDLYKSNRIKKGDILLFVGFGAGLTWGANVVKWAIKGD
ncbi:MAG: beta-ketoacyl-ACP synthase III [Actinomycetota bacterium]|nr:beta-ketoacyl-ACP synthase III [Actinomycetota bacterium]